MNFDALASRSGEGIIITRDEYLAGPAPEYTAPKESFASVAGTIP
jgi:hypothetical protein